MLGDKTQLKKVQQAKKKKKKNKDDGKVSMAISADTCFKEDVTLLVLGEYKAIKKCFCI